MNSLNTAASLQHDNTDTASLTGIDIVVGIHPRRNIPCAIVEEVVVQLTTTRSKQLLLKE